MWDKGGGAVVGGHGGSKNRLKLLQTSQLSEPIRGRGELAVVGGPVTRQPDRSYCGLGWLPCLAGVLQ